jgi:hypothetical protein
MRTVLIVRSRRGSARSTSDRRVWRYVDLQPQSIEFKAILDDGTFSGGERRLVEITASLFNQEHTVNLWSVLQSLDDERADAVENAIATYSLNVFQHLRGIGFGGGLAPTVHLNGSGREGFRAREK